MQWKGGAADLSTGAQAGRLVLDLIDTLQDIGFFDLDPQGVQETKGDKSLEME